jgi:hypothetical protein
LNEFSRADTLLQHLKHADPASHPWVSRMLCTKIGELLEPYYSQISPKNVFFPKEGSDADMKPKSSGIPMTLLRDTIFPLLRHVHFHLYHDVLLFVKAMRIVKDFFKSEVPEDEMKEKIKNIITRVFLPALTLLPANPSVCVELFDLLKVFFVLFFLMKIHRTFHILYVMLRIIIGKKL